MGSSLFDVSNRPDRSYRHEATTTTSNTLGTLTTWGLTLGTLTTKTAPSRQTLTTAVTSSAVSTRTTNLAKFATNKTLITLSPNNTIQVLTTNTTSNHVHVDVRVEKIIIAQPGSPSDHEKTSHVKQGHTNTSSESTEKLSKDETVNTTSTKIWITVGACLG